jgi:hypothetical protein
MRRAHSSGLRPAALLLAAAVFAVACDKSPSTPPAPVVASVGVEPATASLLVAATLPLTATARDAAGVPITGRTVAWHSENQSVATVTPAGSVAAVAPGQARITATVDGKVGASTITVTQPPVGSVTVTPSAHTLGVAGSVTLTATVRDVNGAQLTGRTVTWTSGATGIATVDGNGVVRGVAPGTAVITAASEGVTGTAQILVSASAAVVISAVSPATMQEGQTAVITGAGFSPEAALNDVQINSVPATVLTATATSLTVRVPESACLPARDVAVRVTVSGLTDQRLHPWRPASFLDLPVGQQLRLSGGSITCLQLDASTSASSYLIGVQSVSEVAAELTPIALRSSTPGSISGNPALDGAYAAAPSGHDHAHGTVTLPTSRTAQLMRAHRAAELEFRLEERRQLQHVFDNPARYARAEMLAASLAAGQTSAAVPGNVQVGDSVKVRFPLRSNPCGQSTPLNTVVRYRGTRSIWLEDVANPAGGLSSGEYAQFGEMFDTRIYAANEEYFGEPTDLDGNGRIVIVVTKEINRDSISLGRVYAADLFPRECPAANGGEFFYGFAPDPDGTVGPRFTTQDARENYPIIIAHELAHVIQFGRRSNAPGATAFQTLWEMEGQATLAEEIVGHRITGNRPGQNYGFGVAWNTPAVQPINWYINPIIDLILYFGFESTSSTVTGAPEQCGWLGITPRNENIGPCLGNRNIYGVTWSFLRWISDHFGPTFPGGEQALHRAMIMDTRSGFATLSALTGRPAPELLAQWSAMLYLDGRISGLDPKLTLTSWDFHGGTGAQPGSPQATGIWANLIPTAQLRPREKGFTGFLEEASVRAGSTAYYLINGNGRPATALSVQGAGGGALPLGMQVWIVRLQ